MSDDSGRFTVVSFHAHPDDEALLTGGTLARAAADGHRVVLVVATAGEAGLARRDVVRSGLADQRLLELEASAAAIGIRRVEVLGYPDSGYPAGCPVPGDAPAPPVLGDTPVTTFARTEVEAAAGRLAAILREERADVLTVYDPGGGYGHPDHVQVHRVGVRAAELAGTPVVLEATVDRRLLRPVGLILRALARVVALPAVPDLWSAYTSHGDLTHRVDVRGHLDAKLGSLRAHASQAGADGGVRTLALLLRLPRPLARRVLGREWFRERGRDPGAPLLDDIFASLRRTTT
jgi:LmbE family N-acetylglucosaminyl deacetylase